MKYLNKKTYVDNFKFDSIKEANRYKELQLLYKAKKIKNLILQPEFKLQESFIKNGKRFRAIKYRADFAYFDIELNKSIVEDVKGFKTKDFLIKQKLFEYKYKDLTLELI